MGEAPERLPRRHFLPYLFRASFRALAGANVSLRLAAILIVPPVAGFRPSRAGESLTLNLPNPGTDTSSPAVAAVEIAPNTESRRALALFLGRSCSSAACPRYRLQLPCRNSLPCRGGRNCCHGPAYLSKRWHGRQRCTLPLGPGGPRRRGRHRPKGGKNLFTSGGVSPPFPTLLQHSSDDQSIQPKTSVDLVREVDAGRRLRT